MKKIGAALLLILSLFSCGNKNKETLFLGYNLNGYVDYLKERDPLINSSFTMQKGYISYLYSMVVKDGVDIINNKKLSTLIKNSSLIYIQIGNDDFLRCLNKEDNKYYIDDEILKTQKELFSYYYFLLVEEIREIYDGKITILSPFFSLSNKYENMSLVDVSLNEFYEVANEVSSYFDCEYIDIRQINNLINDTNELTNDSFAFLDQLIGYGN